MIKRIMGGLGTLFVCFCVGTLISQAFLAAHLWSKWQLDRDKCAQLLTLAQGEDLVVVSRAALPQQEELAPEQPSLEEITEARLAEDLALQLREQALRQAQEQVRFQQRTLSDQLKRHKQVEEAFRTELAMLDENEKGTGMQTNVAMLQSMKPKQAKEQLVRMYDDGELDQVVMLMVDMADAKRKKICGEFRTDEENEKLGEILRRIREGFPLAMAAEESQKQLQGTKPE
jgi:hypothetical protein